MSAPTPAPGDDRPREGYYPDPSIPGYVRYWNGTAWVPGTSRPAPKDGEQLSPPPGVRPAPPVAEEPPPVVEETGPHFFDEDPVSASAADAPAPAEPYFGGRPAAAPAADDSRHGSRPEPASAWGADRSRQTGFGTDQDRRVSWGAGQSAAPGTTPEEAGAAPVPDPAAGGPAAGHTVVFRRPAPGAAGSTGGAGAPTADGP
ncbi:MAG TPA: DUF2510 domain-containing protein, partial [Streptomyces sp.]|nr:DUF2510 domain-containing protein [Streptomyces sp.]